MLRCLWRFIYTFTWKEWQSLLIFFIEGYFFILIYICKCAAPCKWLPANQIPTFAENLSRAFGVNQFTMWGHSKTEGDNVLSGRYFYWWGHNLHHFFFNFVVSKIAIQTIHLFHKAKNGLGINLFYLFIMNFEKFMKSSIPLDLPFLDFYGPLNHGLNPE